MFLCFCNFCLLVIIYIHSQRTGSVGGNGPTCFLMSRKKVKTGFDDKGLVQDGAEVGSHVQMTEKGFMTEAAWLEMTPRIIKGYRSMPYIKENPQWYMIEILDGFGAHLNNHDALKMRFDETIICI